MDIRHEIGGDMHIYLEPSDVSKLKDGYPCVDRIDDDGVRFETTVLRDPDVTEPIAETSGHGLNVFLPAASVRLPLEVPVSRFNGPAAEFYFGEAGKVVLSAAIEI